MPDNGIQWESKAMWQKSQSSKGFEFYIKELRPYTLGKKKRRATEGFWWYIKLN